MTQPNKPGSLGDRAADLAAQARTAAGPALDRAQATAKDLADKAAPYVDKATEKAAPLVGDAAKKLDERTHGKYSSTINSVSSKITGLLGRGKR